MPNGPLGSDERYRPALREPEVPSPRLFELIQDSFGPLWDSALARCEKYSCISLTLLGIISLAPPFVMSGLPFLGNGDIIVLINLQIRYQECTVWMNT